MLSRSLYLLPIVFLVLLCYPITNYHPLGRSTVPEESGRNFYVDFQCSDLETDTEVLLLYSLFFLCPACLDYAEGECPFVQHPLFNKSAGATVIVKCAACRSIAGFSAAFFRQTLMDDSV